MRKTSKVIAAGLILGLGAVPAAGASDGDGWNYEVTPYMLFAGMDGTVGVRGYTTDFDVSFSDIWDDLDIGFMGLFTAQKGPWTFGLEGVYMKLNSKGSTSVSGPGGIVEGEGKLDVTTAMYVYQGSVGYRVLDGKTKVDGIGGIRYTKLSTDMKVKIVFDDPPFDDITGGVKGSESWFDAVAGVRVTHPVSDKVTLVGYADIGGGGSDLTYQVMGGLNWEFSEGYSAKVGYRYLSWDYEDGGTVWDASASGPYLGVGIRF